MNRKEQYKQYLTSKDWKAKRTKKIRGRKCAICHSGKGLHVHHLIYRKWTDVKQSDLRVLCWRCHKLVHRLIDTGKLKYDGPHDRRWILTVNAVHRELDILLGIDREKSSPPVRPDLGKGFTVTERWLRKYSTDGQAWNRRQLEAIGIGWPPQRGWFKAVTGMSINMERKARFEMCRTVPNEETRVRF